MITCNISPGRTVTVHAPSSPVEGEHNANIIAVTIPSRVGDADLDGCTMYACTRNDRGDVDKIPLEMIPSDDGYTATWIVTRNTTALHGVITLYYTWERGTDLVAKTYPEILHIRSAPDVDGEIAQQYPTILQDYGARIKNLEENGPGPGYKIGDGLILQGGVLSVDTINEVEEDNTKPVTSGAVYMQLGNVEALLANI
ncbi:hypothetical protein [Solibaculum mannosilyticum]|uniref:Uncharacterized protein n=1 Tax=Solibaculum mannosilyticum TaxID=2780922 RepID=A0A7I8D4F4_9FIRM|nr:hypothetical protein [Solibaculum mannosilyticum]BCI60652.1 hypothetical protein C12CBH8_12910 [Solibaculum mannosilyticum]